MTVTSILISVIAALGAAVAFYFVGRGAQPAVVPESEDEKRRVLAAAQAEAEAMKRQAAVEAKEIAQKSRTEVESELRARRQDVERQSAEVTAKGQALDRRERDLRGEQEAL